MSDGGGKEERARAIVRRLVDAGWEAYWAGGCVRDRLLGRAAEDIDIATSARPDEVAALFPKTVGVGKAFGVMLVILDGESFEVATFRSEGTYSDGRHPDEVRFSSAREDVLRRDFTINGLLYDPLSDRVIDWVGGRDDLAAGRIRTIGDPEARFREDHLRLLRAVRFAVTLGFEIDPSTEAGIRALAPSIARVSAERIGAEMERILLAPGRGRGLRLLASTGLLAAILPEVDRTRGVEQPPEFHPEGDVFVHTALVLDALRDPGIELAYAALLHDVGKPATFRRLDRIRFNNHDEVGAAMAAEILERLRTSSSVRDHAVWLIRNHMILRNVPEMRPARRRRLMADPRFPDLLELLRADSVGSLGDVELHRQVLRLWEEVKAEPALPPPLLRGRDLIALGFAPGEAFGEILKDVQDRQLEGALATRDEAIAHVLATRERPGGAPLSSSRRAPPGSSRTPPEAP
ncbi:MAG: CCA tRNA nucleotidyltransferase [Planctomycetes bacterium]|nr:CCA tRNA nucleotidyltransferase [Planctomycetota bacterium]